MTSLTARGSIRISGAEYPCWPKLAIWASHHAGRTVVVLLDTAGQAILGLLVVVVVVVDGVVVSGAAV